MTIHNLGNYILNNYIIETNLGLILIDTGYPKDYNKFIKRFTKRWDISELKYIFITHHHDDHVGFLADLTKICDAKIILHHKTNELIKKGKSYDPPGSGYSSKFASLFGKIKKDFTFPKVLLKENAILYKSEKDQIFENLGINIKILDLKGHTEDSIGLFLPEEKILFAGDAAMNTIINPNKHTIWIDDPKTFKKTWYKIIELNPNTIYPSHGTQFKTKKLIKHINYLDNRKLY